MNGLVTRRDSSLCPGRSTVWSDEPFLLCLLTAGCHNREVFSNVKEKPPKTNNQVDLMMTSAHTGATSVRPWGTSIKTSPCQSTYRVWTFLFYHFWIELYKLLLTSNPSSDLPHFTDNGVQRHIFKLAIYWLQMFPLWDKHFFLNAPVNFGQTINTHSPFGVFASMNVNWLIF